MWGSKILLICFTAALLCAAVLAFVLWSRSPLSETALNYFSKNFLLEASLYEQQTITVFLLRNVVIWSFLVLLTAATWNHFAKLKELHFLETVLYIITILVLLKLLIFPLQYYRSFILEHSFGLSTQPFSSWLLDYFKGTALELIITTAVLTGFFILVKHFPNHWWWIGGTAAVLLLLASAYLHPLIVDPLFYNHYPLKNEKINHQVTEMANEAGIDIDEVLVADASQRTQKVNASFSGVGRTRRIVIYDNLLERYSSEKALAVIAHEIGHWMHSHLFKGILLRGALAFLALYLLSKVYKEMGINGDLRIITAALIFFALFSFLLFPAQNALSRTFERQADAEALRLVEDAGIHVSLHQQLAQANLSQVDPHPVIKTFLHTHPPAVERINRAVQE